MARSLVIGKRTDLCGGKAVNCELQQNTVTFSRTRTTEKRAAKLGHVLQDCFSTTSSGMVLATYLPNKPTVAMKNTPGVTWYSFVKQVSPRHIILTLS